MCIFDENQGIMLHVSIKNYAVGGSLLQATIVTLEYLHRQIMQSFYSRNKNQSLTTASGNHHFGSVAEYRFSDQWVLVSNSARGKPVSALLYSFVMAFMS